MINRRLPAKFSQIIADRIVSLFLVDFECRQISALEFRLESSLACKRREATLILSPQIGGSRG
jgi:hypothetical protein